MKSQRILVIEDEFVIALEIGSALEDAGFSGIEHADNEVQALHRIASDDWDGVVADANLNGQGIDRVVAALGERSIPFIVVTGYAKHVLPASIGDAPVIEKPFHGRAIADALGRVLQARKVCPRVVQDGACECLGSCPAAA